MRNIYINVINEENLKKNSSNNNETKKNEMEMIFEEQQIQPTKNNEYKKNR